MKNSLFHVNSYHKVLNYDQASERDQNTPHHKFAHILSSVYNIYIL